MDIDKIHRALRTCTLIAIAATLPLATAASAPGALRYCNQPQPPHLFVRPPTKPYCVQTKSCRAYDVNSYNESVDRYFDGLKDYLRDVDRYRTSAYEYAKCMADID